MVATHCAYVFLQLWCVNSHNLYLTLPFHSQTDCTGVAHFADWVTTPGSSHPRSFTPSDLTPHLAARLHTGAFLH